MKLFRNNKNIDDFFRSKLNNFEDQPSDEVWQRISRQMTQVPAWKYYLRLTAFAGFFIFMFGSSFFLKDTLSLKSNGSGLLMSSMATKPVSGSGSNLISGNLRVFENWPANEINPAEEEIEASSNMQVVSEARTSPVEVEKNERFVFSTTGIHPGVFASAKRGKPSEKGNNEKDEFDKYYQEYNGRMFSNLNGFSMGIVYNHLNTQILSNHINDLPLTSKMTFGNSYGLTASYDFRGRLGIQANILVNSTEGQTYVSNSYFDEMEEFPVVLNYTRIPVMVKYRINTTPDHFVRPMMLNLLLGVQYGRLNWVNIDREMKAFQPADFNTHEIGITGGVNYDFFLNNNYSVSIGAVSNLSTAPDSFQQLKGSDNIYNLSFGLSAKINYHFDRN